MRRSERASSGRSVASEAPRVQEVKLLGSSSPKLTRSDKRVNIVECKKRRNVENLFQSSVGCTVKASSITRKGFTFTSVAAHFSPLQYPLGQQ